MQTNRDSLKLGGAAPVREFRVKSVRRYIVTDWSDYRGGSVTQIAECETLDQANTIAETFGRAHPGSLVNGMDPKAVEAWDGAAMQFALTADQAQRLNQMLAGHGGIARVLTGEFSKMTDAERLDGGLIGCPYQLAAAVRRLASAAGDDDMIARLDRLQVAVDA